MLAPAELLPPQGPTGITWGALSNADVAVVVKLSERISVREHPAWSESLDDIHKVLGHSRVDPGLDGMLALDDAGTAVAWGLVIAYRASGLERAILDVDTENAPGALGVYTRLGFVPIVWGLWSRCIDRAYLVRYSGRCNSGSSS